MVKMPTSSRQKKRQKTSQVISLQNPWIPYPRMGFIVHMTERHWLRIRTAQEWMENNCSFHWFNDAVLCENKTRFSWRNNFEFFHNCGTESISIRKRCMHFLSNGLWTVDAYCTCGWKGPPHTVLLLIVDVPIVLFQMQTTIGQCTYLPRDITATITKYLIPQNAYVNRMFAEILNNGNLRQRLFSYKINSLQEEIEHLFTNLDFIKTFYDDILCIFYCKKDCIFGEPSMQTCTMVRDQLLACDLFKQLEFIAWARKHASAWMLPIKWFVYFVA